MDTAGHGATGHGAMDLQAEQCVLQQWQHEPNQAAIPPVRHLNYRARDAITEHLEALFPIFVTDSCNRVMHANPLAESLLEISLADARGQNLAKLLAECDVCSTLTAVGSSSGFESRDRNRSLRLELVAIADEDRLVWRLSDNGNGVSHSERSTRFRERGIRGEAYVRIDPPNNSRAGGLHEAAPSISVTTTREEVLSRLEEERLSSLVPRLTSLFGHLHLAMLHAEGVALRNSPQGDSQIVRSISMAKEESERIAEQVREIRNLRHSVYPRQSSQILRTLIDRSLRLVAAELDVDEIELECSDRLKEASESVITDGVVVCQAVVWLLRTLKESLSPSDRRVFMDCYCEEGALSLGVSFNRDPNKIHQPDSLSGLLESIDSNPRSDKEGFKLLTPTAPITWMQKHYCSGRSTITVRIPCSRGVK